MIADIRFSSSRKVCSRIRWYIAIALAVLLSNTSHAFTASTSSSSINLPSWIHHWQSVILPTNKLPSQSRLYQQSTSATRSDVQEKENDNFLHRSDYQEPAFWVTHASLDFQFHSESSVRVISELTVVSNTNSKSDGGNLVLQGDPKRLELFSISLLSNNDDSRILSEGVDYEYDKTSPSKDLIVYASTLLGSDDSPKRLQLVVDLDPSSNDHQELSGLYCRDDLFCTHCEPSGFRQITYFSDRPDNCAIFKVRLEADKERYPILLSNGNLVESGESEDDSSSIRHYAIFEDPHPKPCYIFGLVVANNMECIKDSYTTMSGKQVQLTLYGEPEQVPKLTFAMETLKKAMKWDEETYGLEYDLDTYIIVAAKHFNIGAMENKGLNLFMTSLIATDPSCTTDITYDLVEKTIAHEYFHNWSGNRVTVRDWFEFTLKEGLTVYRDQEFTSDVGLSLATRIEAVKILREKQFAEDASDEQRQPIRPERYLSQEHSLDCLATSTTYHKGAEVCRMYKTLLGKEGFRKGLNLYMSRHDGRGATCDDFWKAMADANQAFDLEQFFLWYSTAGTPTVSYEYQYDEDGRKLELKLSQRLTYLADDKCKDGPLLHIPVAVGLLDKTTGSEVVPTHVLDLKERTQTFVFEGLSSEAVPSLLRDFSAPVYLTPSTERSKADEEAYLSLLATNDTDGFNRWEAMQELLSRFVLTMLEEGEQSKSSSESIVLKSFGNILTDSNVDASSKSYMLNFPSEAILSRMVSKPYDPTALLDARKRAMEIIGQTYQEALQEVYDKMKSQVLATPKEQITDAVSRATRSLRNRCLEYLVAGYSLRGEPEQAASMAKAHFEQATCFTDRLLAFRQIASLCGNKETMEIRNEVTLQFFQLAFTEAASKSPSTRNTILNKWFQVQSLADLEDALPRVQALMQGNPHFKANNAGRFRSLITSFTKNTRSFHTNAGYQFIGHIIRQMDRRSPILATELARELAKWPQIKGERAKWMVDELQSIRSMDPISKPLLMTVSRSLEKMKVVSKTNISGEAKSQSFGVGNAKSEMKSRKKKKKGGKAKKGFS